MSIEFNNESEQQKASQLYARIQSSNQASGMEQWLINKGIVKTSQQAKLVFIVVVIVCLSISGFLLFSNNNEPSISPSEQKMLDDQIRNMEI